MADRQIIFAAHAAGPAALSAVFPDHDEPETVGAWTWLNVDPWAPGRERHEARLRDLEGPLIRLATEDDCRWYLRIWAGGEPVLGACNHLALLGGEEYEDAEFESLGALLDDYNELVPGDCLPPAAVREHDASPPDEGVALYLKIQAEAVTEVLGQLGIPHQPDEVVDCLTGESLTDGERGWPLGNLPRFADCLGLPAFADWQEELAEYEELDADDDADDDQDDEEDDDDDEVQEEDSDAEVIFGVLEAGEELEACPLEDGDGGPAGALEILAAQLQLVRQLSWFCDQSTDVALRLRLPASGVTWSELPHQASELPEGFLVDAMEGGRIVRIGLRPTSIWEELPLLGLLGRVLEVLPDGARVDLMSYSDLEDRTAGNHRYCGPVRQGKWYLELAYPPRQRDELQEALELSAQVATGGPVLAASEEEAGVVAAAAQETMDLRQRGAELWGDDAARLHLVRALFHQRFQQRWELEEELTEEELAPVEVLQPAPNEQDMSMAFIEASQSIGDMFNRIMGKAPPGAEELHKGEAARFYRVNLEEHIGSNPLVKFAGLLGNAPGDGEEADWTVASVDAGMAALGFSPLGDLVCDWFMEVPMRGYAPAEGDTYGTLVTSPMGEAFPEFYSQFDDGASLITSVKVDEPLPEKKIYRLHLPGGTIEELYAKHRQGIALRNKEDGAAALPAEPVLEGLARAIDAFIKRRL